MGKTTVLCGAIDCKNNRDNVCCLSKINMGEWYVHTVYNGLMHLWECKQYEKDNALDYIMEKFKEYLEKKG